MVETLVYKVLTAEEFSMLERGRFTGAAVDRADGYIHLSTAAQLAETLAKHFAGQSNLVLAAVDLHALGDAIHWEVSRGGQLFPHLYGDLTMAAVRAYAPPAWDATGALVLPG